MPLARLFASTMLFASAFILVACQNDGSSNEATPGVGSPSLTTTSPPPTAIDIVEDRYHGQIVADPYRWLEDGDAEAVTEWSARQAAYARNFLDALPGREPLRSTISDLLKRDRGVSYGSLRYVGDETILALKRDPLKQQLSLVAMTASGDPATERIVVDPEAIDDSAATSIDWYEPSHDGSKVAVSLSRGGSESGDVHVYDVATAEPIDTIIERVNGATAGGDVAWFPDDSGFFYTRYPRDGERPDEDLLFYQQVWQHQLGSPANDDSLLIGGDFPRIAQSRIDVDPESGRLLVWVQAGDSGRFSMHLRQPDGDWQQFSHFDDGHFAVGFGPDESIVVVSRDGAPRGKVLITSASAPDLSTAMVLIPEAEGSISNWFYFPFSPSVVTTEDRVYVVYDVGGPQELLVFSTDGERLDGPEQLPVSATNNLAMAGGNDVFFNNASYTASRVWYRYDAESGETLRLPITSDTPDVYATVDVVREFATSEDGTQVPVNILIPQGAEKDGTRAIVVTGYGGYGISMSPGLFTIVGALLDNGVLFAEANLRGGGEYGAEWHDQGRLTNKQNVFDDFAAVIRHLVASRYADRDRVAIIGGSNGGILVGATIVQNPDLIAAASGMVGIYDMLRFEVDPNGEFNVPEFGTVEDPAQFAALHAYSPYHNVIDGTVYPPTLLSTGANDLRVNPAHSRKFAARLQAAQGGNNPVLLRMSMDTGHGMGTPLDEIIELWADQFAFLLQHLKVPVADARDESFTSGNHD